MANQQPQPKKLHKGEMLFSEGESSRAMYYLKTGIIRIFKKRGEGHIEIDTVHAGQILGELSFLDGNPRSASGEAMTECEVIEIGGPVFQQTLDSMPEWVKILIKTISSRLRNSSTRIRQLESMSTAVDYAAEKEGKGAQKYTFINNIDALKIFSAILLAATRHGKKIDKGFETRLLLINRYANQIMGVPVAKITALCDALTQAGILPLNEATDSPAEYLLTDPDFVESAIAYINEENLAEESKRHDISLRGFLIMSLMNKYLNKFPKDDRTGLVKINMADVKKQEQAANPNGKEPFKTEDIEELVKLGYTSNLELKSGEEIYAAVNPETFPKAYRLQRMVMTIHAINEQKRKKAA